VLDDQRRAKRDRCASLPAGVSEHMRPADLNRSGNFRIVE